MVRAAGRIVFGILLLLIGGVLALGGARLLYLGGSPYYLPAGLAVVAAGALVLRRRWRTAAALYLGLILATLAWALIEAGLDGWALMPRLISPFVLGLPFLVAALIGRRRSDRLAGLAVVTCAVLLSVAVWAGSGFRPVNAVAEPIPPQAADETGEWRHFGNSQAGTHFSPLTQLTPANVGKLEMVWQRKVGPMPTVPISVLQTVPLKVGDHLYACTQFSDMMDLDPETGKQHWYFAAHNKAEGISVTRCRGLAYYDVPGATGACARRVYAASSAPDLVALDADTGQLCPGFGSAGRVDLTRGLKQRNKGYYGVTSAPTLIRGKLVIGGNVADGQYAGEPSGVVRAYDAVTGKLAWAWDMGNPGQHGEPPEGRYYTSGTPNSWGPMSADESLGLVYVPTGNSTPDYWGGHRSPESNRYSSALVAIDAETGEPRWSFQTTHYDLWDFDVASQPVLFELQTAHGLLPAVIQPTKRGELFVLDRRSGKPIFPVVERPAPQRGAVEKISPTQPWSPGMPSLVAPRVTENAMWGITAVDQLWCRIKFREARYDGPLTPPGLDPIIADPGYIGGVDWGSATIDQGRQLAFILSNRIVNHIQLLPRSHAKARHLKAASGGYHGGLVPQEGAPYAADVSPFLSPIGVPCQQPPHGMINAIDLKTGKLAWSRPLGTARGLGPMGTVSRLPFTIGTPSFGGPMSTAGGLVFAAGAQDHAIRAFDGRTGRMLFVADLPGNSSTTPMSFWSAKSGRQFVVIASDATRTHDSLTGAITAYALPRR
ncbi:MAG: membrane-bound PQQ-dependent dehydrogenase, glucose/quinate/shikimate family [Sphingomonadales bacterium]|nr:membrane-bound PQQ-dependent dehydrogenase, glucose/quinate/shikimate family [Sphingomonadales bacterium]